MWHVGKWRWLCREFWVHLTHFDTLWHTCTLTRLNASFHSTKEFPNCISNLLLIFTLETKIQLKTICVTSNFRKRKSLKKELVIQIYFKFTWTGNRGCGVVTGWGSWLLFLKKKHQICVVIIHKDIHSHWSHFCS